MKKYFLLMFLAVLTAKFSIGQISAGTYKVCPDSRQWKANSILYSNEREMFNDYAKGPKGCWWYKYGNFASYDKGDYTFMINGRKRTFRYLGKKGWSNGSACVPNPFTGKF